MDAISASPWNRAVETLPGIGPARAALLAQLGIGTVRDLLFHFPRAYEDRRAPVPIGALAPGGVRTVQGEIVRRRRVELRGGRSMAVIAVRDGTGEVAATWFGRGALAARFPLGTRVVLTGAVGVYNGLALRNPEYDILAGGSGDGLNTGRVVPIYRLAGKLTQRALRRWIHAALDACADLPGDPLPAPLRERLGFAALSEALRAAHFPREIAEGERARDRFAYEELLGLQLGVLRARAGREAERKGYAHVVGGPLLAALGAALPFALTAAQRRAVDAVLADMASARPMVRLLEGDVGCGKTAVALHAIAAACDGGFQTAFMAPTEILAEQHALTLRARLAPLGVAVELLTAGAPGAAAARARLARGEALVAAGTHALIEERTIFRRLGLAIIDEQHRFGVVQRGLLAAKGAIPDILHMTATPIPRTLALTACGAMDISVIDELPPGRLPVKTARVPPAKLPGLHAYIRTQAARGFQTYYVCPLVEESEKIDLSAVTRRFEELRAGPLAGLRAALIHGRLDAAEKDAVMRRFTEGALDILFGTTVVEVGIDAPRATTMVIEDAARFGLTQLHQLRGRVGRGREQSWCFLLGKAETPEGRRRLEILCATTDGFKIAEEDLALRGPGQFRGCRQAGLCDLRVADPARDARLLAEARSDAERILAADARLEAPAHQGLAEAARAHAAIPA
ncbi:MAG TPA: ATP-dependent DNA helicase RecG [Planctomycetota bacterium]|mgnify:CR=1 FL=1|jgi:ATP-dependent DNA helicase RecG|nr:ATP-dependent DNA helicase RecG [Planctomycetota bacterium]OQC20456.1 MAG: ATP-dependent DNA helicase RecG [Planctomycetes bacterium ADurb.Bin069]HNR99072.1 ATP-dependent DNA helicase RecG [Planctomycetota bacterium]HNU26235.1 ATP-dependent DNA helicase RecG [Planctomycetota bacterium]HOE30790.1 ATP-dependent DNA helicase RecG [Planctomycetota bacterium]